MLTQLQSVREVLGVHKIAALHFGGLPHVAIKCMLYRDLASILLAQKTAHYRALLLAESVAGDVVGDGEEDERVQDDLDLGALLARDERIRRLCFHGDVDVVSPGGIEG
jgi:hypothetical protein